jgi:hypothetical protein
LPSLARKAELRCSCASYKIAPQNLVGQVFNLPACVSYKPAPHFPPLPSMGEGLGVRVKPARLCASYKIAPHLKSKVGRMKAEEKTFAFILLTFAFHCLSPFDFCLSLPCAAFSPFAF